MIPYSTQNITLLDRIRVFRALGKPYLTQGPAVEDFEHAVAAYVGANHAVAVNSATSALHIACLALGLGPGDIMWTTPISFVASANCGRYCGAEVDFVDIDPETFNMSPQELKKKLEVASKNGTVPKVLVVVHLAGEPADMQEIATEARKYGVKIIEDASHALGSSSLGEKVGSGKYSDITVFSFHAVKNMTTGEGGMAVTQNSELSKAMRLLRSHGITREKSEFQTEIDNQSPWHYEQITLGFNYRLTDFQSILGISQLRKLDTRNRHRRTLLDRYIEELSSLKDVRFQKSSHSSQSATHLAIVRVPEGLRRELTSRLKSEGFLSNLHYFPIHLQPYYLAEKARILPAAEAFARTAVSLPCHDKVRSSTVVRISSILKDVFASR